MGTKTFNNYEDILTFTRASKGHALRPVSYGNELVVNGGFDTDSDWTKGTGWTISGGAAVSNNVSGYGDVRQDLSLTANKIYRLEFSVTSYTSGVVKPFLGNSGNSLAEPYARGNLTVGLTADSAGDFYAFFVYDASQPASILIRSNNGFIGSIDNVSVKEVFFDQTDGTLTLFEHPDNVPRVEWDADRNRLGLLVEESRTNLWIFSEDMSQTSFGGTGGTATTDQYVAPDGTQTGDLVTMTSGQVYAYKSATISTPTNVAYTISCYVKAAEANTSVGFRIGEFGGAAAGKFHDSGYTAISSTEWTRLDFTQTLEQSDRTQVQAVIRTTSQTGSLLMWGVQLEQGSFPTSYIKTTGSTATRSADVASIPVADFGYNQSAGTLITTVETFDTDYNSWAWTINGVDDTFAYTHSSGAWRIAGAGGTVGYVGSLPSDDFFKLGYAFDESGSAAVADGGSVASPSHSQPTEAQTLHIGTSATSGSQLNGHIKSIKYYPRRLTNAQLQDITS